MTNEQILENTTNYVREQFKLLGKNATEAQIRETAMRVIAAIQPSDVRMRMLAKLSQIKAFRKHIEANRGRGKFLGIRTSA